MSSKFAVSQSRAQNTPKVCKSKHPEASAVVIPTWQRAVISIDIAADKNNTGARILATTWLTRSGPHVGFSYIDTQVPGVAIGIEIREPVSGEPDDVTILIASPAMPPAFPARTYTAALTTRAWTHTLYGEPAPLIADDLSQAGIVTVRFSGSAPTLA